MTDNQLSTNSLVDRDDWALGVRVNTNAAVWSGTLATVVILGGFLVWALTAPLAGAAVAPGIIAVSGQNQRIQHLEGGIIRGILVEEGDRVKAGQPMFELDPAQARTAATRLEKQLIAMSAREARLLAERDGATAIEFEPQLVQRAHAADAMHALDEQKRQFEVQRVYHEQQLSILQHQRAALDDQIPGMEAEEEAYQRQIALLDDEIKRKEMLLNADLTTRSDYSLLLRAHAELLGELAQVRSRQLVGKAQIAEVEAKIVQLGTERIRNVTNELSTLGPAIADSREQLAAANEVLERSVITAPSDGIVVRLFYNTEGSVVGAGGVVAEILPTGESLVIEARVSPRDIDAIHLGQSANLHFTALNAQTTPVVPATLTYVSADRFVDQQTFVPYYVARLSIVEGLPDQINESQLYPGMPVEAFIKTEERTFAQYLFRPISDSFGRAFTEE